MKRKYTTSKINNIITQITIKTDVKGYTVGIIESFIPDEDVMIEWSNKECDEWIKVNNKRMTAICKFLNDNDL